jgi:hypothetical protein
MFYDRQFCRRKLNASSGFITHLYNCLYTDGIFVIRHPDDGHWSDQTFWLIITIMIEHIYKCAIVGLSYTYKIFFNAWIWNT